MTREAVIAQVQRLGATDKKPALDATAVGLLVDGYKIVDTAGNLPDSPAWTPTYNVNAAVAEVWRTKAAQVAGDFTFTADDATYNKGDVLDNMLAMETKYTLLAEKDMAARPGGTASTLDVAGTQPSISVLDQIARQVIP